MQINNDLAGPIKYAMPRVVVRGSLLVASGSRRATPRAVQPALTQQLDRMKLPGTGCVPPIHP